MTVLVVGGTGRVGSLVLDGLRARGVESRAAGRHAEVRLDHDEPSTVGPALVGVRELFVAVPDRPDSVDVEVRLYRAAAAAGVERIVKLSAASAGWRPPRSFGIAHRAAEEALATAGPSWTVLRPTTFQETVGLFADDVARGRMVVPMRKGAVAFVSVADVAEVAVRALVDDDLAGRTLELTGPSAWTFREIASALSPVVGRRVRHVPMPRTIARRMLPRVTDMSPWLVAQLVELFAGLDAGLQSRPHPDVADVLGRPARPIDPFLDELGRAAVTT